MNRRSFLRGLISTTAAIPVAKIAATAALDAVAYTSTVGPYLNSPAFPMDASAWFQAMIDDAVATGRGAVYLPAGNYRFSPPVRIPPGLFLEGTA